RLLGYMESRNAIVCRVDFSKNRIVALPALGCETAPGDPKADVAEAAPPEQSEAGAGWGLFAAE
ncbi:ATP-binding protein, partial [Methylobacterium sp. WL122]